MKLRLVSAVIALVVCSATHGNCMRDTLGDTICGQGPRSNDRNGRGVTTRRRLSVGLAVVLRTYSPENNVVPRTRGRCREKA